MLKVKCHPETIQRLNHRLTFATDEKVNGYLLTKYRLYEYLTPCEADNLAILQTTINEWADYFNKIYETTLYEYNPIENYDRVEEGTDLRTDNLKDERDTTNTPNNWKTAIKQSGYESEEPTLTSESEQMGTYKTDDDVMHTGTQTNKHDLRVHGNIGVMSTQQMIQLQRDITIDVLDQYVAKFADCFNLTLGGLSYGCM